MSARVLRFPTATPPRHEPLCRADGPWGARASWPYPVSNWEIDFDTGKGFAVVRHVWVDGSPSEPLYGIAYETVGEVMDGRCRIALGGKVPPPASAWELLRCGCERSGAGRPRLLLLVGRPLDGVQAPRRAPPRRAPTA
jgi:hypothetical protein